MPKEHISKYDLALMTNTLALLLAKKTGEPIIVATQKKYIRKSFFFNSDLHIGGFQYGGFTNKP